MATQLFYESVDIGTEITPLVKHPTTRQLVKWAGADGDYNEVHYDKDFAQKQGLSGVIVHGMLGVAFLGQMLTDWIGEEGTLRKLSCTYRGLFFPGQDAICRGSITKKYVHDNEHCAECEIWLENPKGERVIRGTALVALPSTSEG